MNRFLTYLILLIVAVATGCGDNCEIDKRLESKIDNQIKIIELRHECVTGINSNEMDCELGANINSALFYLNALTGQELYSALNYTNSYINSSIMNSDIKKWRDWYEKNKCGLTIEEADRIVESKSYQK